MEPLKRFTTVYDVGKKMIKGNDFFFLQDLELSSLT